MHLSIPHAKREGKLLKILIAGDGKVGDILTQQLSSEGYDITLIDSNLLVLQNSIEHYDVMTVVGNCASMDVLMQAGVTEANLLIAATSADEINLLCCMTAHNINPNIHTIARIRNPEYAGQIYSMRDIFALSLTVNPERQAAVEIERLLKYPGLLKRDTFAKGKVEIVEVRVDSNSKLDGVSLSKLNSIVKCNVLVCTVLRHGKVIAPDGNFVIEHGDRLFVTAPTNDLAQLLHNLGIITRKVKKLIIAGGGRVSYYLALQLQKSNIDVTLIEQNNERCTQLAGMLPNTNIVHGDASNQALLDSEGIESCDAFVAATGLDELNIVMSLYANSCEVPQIITKMSRISNNRIIEHLNIGSVICPKELCCNTIVRYVRAIQNQTGAAVAVHSIADGQAEAIEFRADDRTLHCGEMLKNLNLRKNVLIACISTGGKTVIPNGDSAYHSGDTVLVITSRDTVLYTLNDIFEN